MPIPIPIPQFAVCAVAFEGSLNGQQTITTLHYKLVTSGGTPDGQAEMNNLLFKVTEDDGIFDLYRNCMTQAVVDIRVFGQWIAPVRLRYLESQVGAKNGALAGTTCPPNTAQVVTRQADRASRRGISNLHLPGVPFSSVVNGKLNAFQLALLNDFAQASAVNVLTNSGGEFVPVPFRRGNPLVTETLDNGYAQDTVRVQRRRTVGLGT